MTVEKLPRSHLQSFIYIPTFKRCDHVKSTTESLCLVQETGWYHIAFKGQADGTMDSRYTAAITAVFEDQGF